MSSGWHFLLCQLRGHERERIPERSSHNILPMEVLADKITNSLHESNFACYNCINGITSTADEYNFTSYNCIINTTICGRTVEEDYPQFALANVAMYMPKLNYWIRPCACHGFQNIKTPSVHHISCQTKQAANMKQNNVNSLNNRIPGVKSRILRSEHQLWKWHARQTRR